jgi:hypothetical protein
LFDHPKQSSFEVNGLQQLFSGKTFVVNNPVAQSISVIKKQKNDFTKIGIK